MKTLRTWVIGVGLALGACGGAASVSSSNSETHFLAFCTEDSCGDGLSCICGVCTVTCDPAATCGALHPDAICTQASSGSCGDDTEPSVCDVDCNGDGDCDSLGSDYRCQSGVCRLPGCVYEGQVYTAGESFDTDCNTCTCNDDGEVICTRRACVEECEYDGKTYSIGEEFPGTEECSSCSCTEDGVVCAPIPCPPPTCEYDGNTYSIGEEFPATDGCNSCSCTEDGVVCTDIGCSGVTCEFGGMTYQPGDVIPGECGDCGCTEDGTVVCDPKTCASCTVGDRVYEHGDQFLDQDGCNVCTCENGSVACTAMGCAYPECLLPFEVGPCDAAIPVFYYNPETFQCEERTYGGCEGNDNRFDTLEACQATCREIDNDD